MSSGSCISFLLYLSALAFHGNPSLKLSLELMVELMVQAEKGIFSPQSTLWTNLNQVPGPSHKPVFGA